MRELFPGYYRPSEEEFKTLWENCTFVFDTNVLLDLYRYPEKAREEFLSVLMSKGIFNRFWLPHHAAMEFQRNRLKVAWDSLKPLDDLKKEIEVLKSKIRKIGETIEKGSSRGIFGNIKKHPFQTNSEKEITDLEKALNELKTSRQKEIETDSLREEINKLLNGKIGPPPKDQEELNKIYSEGEKRFSHKMPPGYLDQKKDPEDYLWGSLSFKRKFGDLILWKQIINHAKEKNLNYLIFVMNDNKNDWWWTEEYQGKKITGPRPELIEEIYREANLKGFYMYNVDRFLEFAKKYLEIKFEDSSLSQIKEISESRGKRVDFSTSGSQIIYPVIVEWVTNQYPEALIRLDGQGFPGPDIEVTTPAGFRIGFVIKETGSNPLPILAGLINWTDTFKSNFDLNELCALLIVPWLGLKKNHYKTYANQLLIHGFDMVYFANIVDGAGSAELMVLDQWRKDQI